MSYKQQIARITQQLQDGAPAAAAPVDLTPATLAHSIDHTLLKPDATAAQVDALCAEARRFGFRTVCVRLPFVAQAAARLDGSGVGVCCVVGFHEGTHATDEKLEEAKAALQAGATELDAVLNRAHLSDGDDYADLARELKTLRAAAPAPAVLKLILETARLEPANIVAATVVAYDAGFDFVKTSTGFDGEGATVPNVGLMRRTADVLQAEGGRHMAVKASGGVRTFDDAKHMLAAGAERLGASAGVAIVEQARGIASDGGAPGGY